MSERNYIFYQKTTAAVSPATDLTINNYCFTCAVKRAAVNEDIRLASSCCTSTATCSDCGKILNDSIGGTGA